MIHNSLTGRFQFALFPSECSLGSDAPPRSSFSTRVGWIRHRVVGGWFKGLFPFRVRRLGDRGKGVSLARPLHLAASSPLSLLHAPQLACLLLHLRRRSPFRLLLHLYTLRYPPCPNPPPAMSSKTEPPSSAKVDPKLNGTVKKEDNVSDDEDAEVSEACLRMEIGASLALGSCRAISEGLGG